MVILIQERYKSIRSPYKIKGNVSGCVRECTEAQNRDFGLIATEKGFNIFVKGNGGAKPRQSELLVINLPVGKVIPILDGYLVFYIRTADKLQRTARYVQSLFFLGKFFRESSFCDLCAELCTPRLLNYSLSANVIVGGSRVCQQLSTSKTGYFGRQS
jgi:nitrite reductase (NAD(P)H)